MTISMLKKLRYGVTSFVATITMCQAQTAKVIVSVSNLSQFERRAETVTVNWDALQKLVPGLDAKNVSIVQEGDGRELLYQVFNPGSDFAATEFLFQSDFKANETKRFIIRSSPKELSKDTSLVDARYVEPRQDLAWENDRIAFRVYGPALAGEVNNGIDVWTKRVRYRIVKKWYEGEERTPKIIYHVDHGEGADFFDVGRSLGCGGTGIWFNEKVIQPGVFSSYKIVATGPIRASFELHYDHWSFNGRTLKETKRVTLDAGQNLNRIEVSFKDVQYSEPTMVAYGLVKRPNTKLSKNDEGRWMSLWGLTNADSTNGLLGTGVVLPSTGRVQWTEDSSQYIAFWSLAGKSEFSYYAGAGWTRSGDFNTVEDWNAYLDRFAAGLQSPLKVAVVRGE